MRVLILDRFEPDIFKTFHASVSSIAGQSACTYKKSKVNKRSPVLVTTQSKKSAFPQMKGVRTSAETEKSTDKYRATCSREGGDAEGAEPGCDSWRGETCWIMTAVATQFEIHEAVSAAVRSITRATRDLDAGSDNQSASTRTHLQSTRSQLRRGQTPRPSLPT